MSIPSRQGSPRHRRRNGLLERRRERGGIVAVRHVGRPFAIEELLDLAILHDGQRKASESETRAMRRPSSRQSSESSLTTASTVVPVRAVLDEGRIRPNRPFSESNAASGERSRAEGEVANTL